MSKNVLYITDTGSICGGGEISLLNLLANLDRTKYEPVAAVPDEGDLFRRLAACGVKTCLFGYRKVLNPFAVGTTIRAIRRLCEIIRSERIELVHTNSTGGIVFLAGIACVLCAKPLVSHNRIIDTGLLSDCLQAALSRRIIVISRMMAGKFVFRLAHEKVACIYNGLDLRQWTVHADGKSFKKELGVSADAPLVVCAGTYTRGKGFEYLIKALAVLKERMPSIRACIVGMQRKDSGPYLHSLQRQAARLGVAEMISFLPRQDDMNRIYSAMDVLAFPSLIDPFGRILIEAMACGKPAVGFAFGGARELIEDNKTGFLVRPGDYRQFAGKLETILNDKALAQRFGQDARLRCERFFDIRTHARSMQRLYDEVLEDPAAGYVSCALCASSRFRVLNTCAVTGEDGHVPQARLRLCRCLECGLVYVNPQPKISDDLYAEDYFNAGYMKFYGRDRQDAAQSNEPFDWRRGLILRFKPAGNLLDIGCASGEFLALMRDGGWNTTGIDISEYAVQAARTQYNLDVRKGRLPDMHFADASFDAVSAGDVLEHVPDPVDFLVEAGRVLKDDGILYLAVPNFASVHYGLMSFIAGFNHKNYFVLPHHLYHFSPATATMLLEKAGFTVAERIFTESRIQEKGVRRFVMQTIFLLGRIMRAKDRMVLIARKRRS
ncbi:MAG: glycosyltransferase [Candidatus Omnitrophica bacterium]|nr:glycosyltransferase [Candidatus Omnitrophota bacterium]